MKIAFLTAGGLAPCLSASIGRLINQYSTLASDAVLIGYLNGYKGLLLGNSIEFPSKVFNNYEIFYRFGGSPIGNSRVKLTNIEDCKRQGLVSDLEIPLKVAAEQLVKDGIKILHTIGGDDTNTTAAELSTYLDGNGYDLTVVGMPKTIDNDIFPIKQTLGAITAAEQGALFFRNIANENTTSSRHLIIHEIMGRNCGWLTAATAREYIQLLDCESFAPEALLAREKWNVDAVYIPEMDIDIDAEAKRLKSLMDKKDSVNIFLSEGAGLDSILKEMQKQGDKINKDAYGHVRLDEINPGRWFSKKFSNKIAADKTLVQKSGYFARSAKPCSRDMELICQSADLAVSSALKGKSGVSGLCEDSGKYEIIPFKKIKGGKPFNPEVEWFKNILNKTGQRKEN